MPDDGSSDGLDDTPTTAEARVVPARPHGPTAMNPAAASRPGGPGAPSASASPQTAGARSRFFWVLPVVAFLLGCVLGGVLIGVAQSGSSDASGPDAGVAAPSPTAATSGPNGDLDVAVTVPAACLDAVELASSSLDTVQRGLAALRDFDAAALRDVLGELQDAQPEVSALADQCRAEANLPTVSSGPS